MARTQNPVNSSAAVGAAALDVEVELATRAPEDRRQRPLPFAPVPALPPEDEVHPLARNNTDGPVDVNVRRSAADGSFNHWL